ncbi:transcriptional regulator [Wenzhouxiangella sp. XN79A]|uniref:P-II family nitrogen regulator n=1 Tax=Wenzhouxiangella sp. XN79A TaxID=2724193 RepID=UPI00144AC466|nr:transcriptional regulator [Wenzhouxiangella sp. XN79A]NKI34803.1 transcriptional regulator [Wenzhouxiangella sp. XN79A]
MNTNPGATRRLLTIITESVLETALTRDLEKLGAQGYTIVDARGKGHRGVREGGWEASGNIRLDVVCAEETARKIAAHVQQRYYDDYAMIVLLGEVEVLRPEKF